MKIGILDEGYWSPEMFRVYQAMASMTERCFESPGKCWRASWAKGEVGRLHLAWEASLHLLGLGGKSP